MVLIFWGGFGQQNRWYIGPLITLAPLLLPLLGSGLLGLPLSLLSLLVSCELGGQLQQWRSWEETESCLRFSDSKLMEEWLHHQCDFTCLQPRPLLALHSAASGPSPFSTAVWVWRWRDLGV